MPPLSTRAAGSLAIAAAALPSLLAYNLSPSPTFLNQALAFGLWAGFVTASRAALQGRAAGPLLAAVAVLTMAATWSWGAGVWPSTFALSTIATLAAAALLIAGGTGAHAGQRAVPLFAAFCWAWVAAGVLNIAVASIQVFWPELPDGSWIAASGYPGRAVGNLRQPNHLSSLLLWHCIAVLALFEFRRIGTRTAALLLAAGIFAVVLTASRTGLLSVLLLAMWGLLDRKLSRPARALLLAAPLVYLLAWLAMAQWAALSAHAFGGSARLAESDISSSRFAIWRDTLALIRLHPWAGVGFGEFNLAWTLTPFPDRPVAFFDHSHSVPLQFIVELGLPLGGAVMALLGWALWRGARNAWTAPAGSAAGTAQRCAMLMVLMIGLHSLLEYPLWYSYFLLPAAWAWGFALQPAAQSVPPSPASSSFLAPARPVTSSTVRRPQPASAPAALAATRGLPAAQPAGSRLLLAAALCVAIGAALSVFDYLRVAQIFSVNLGTGSLVDRIAAGRRSVFFAHHADYAAVTSGAVGPAVPRDFARVVHYLLDSRLMIAWAESLAAAGEVDKARHLAARLREFRKVDADEFFAPCPDAASRAGQGLPFQCEQPEQAHDWRAFLQPQSEGHRSVAGFEGR